MLSTTTEQMIAHLEFLGYKVERKEPGAFAKHETNLNLFLQEQKGGVLFSSLFGFQETAKRDKAECLAWINALNETTLLLRFYTNGEFDSLVMQSWYPSIYDKASFGLFVELLNGNIRLLFTDADRAKKFLI
ncbi:MAG: hypothetical protein M1485_07375 [Chloroflexi bacterium]|nr:hypothetical protein [Chloroflexota bacterium]